MIRKTTTRIARRSEQGYALMTILFLLALLTIGLMTIVTNAITDNQREKEQEMVWRGKQYVRGIRLYYQKTHRFPTELEDLYKPKTGIRFMREAYKDPMNAVDGSWRLIYVGPNGQLIGSLKNRNVNAGGQPQQGFGSAAGSSSFGSSSFGSSSFGNSSFGSGNGAQGGGNSSFGNSSFGNSSFGGTSGGINGNNAQQNNPRNGQQNAQNAATGDDADGQSGSSMGDMSTPQAIQPADMGSSNIIGGNIIGVGSKINKKSFLWYDKAKNYRQFEFVWDPSVDSLTGQQVGTIPQNNGGFGTTPNGTQQQNSPFSNGGSNSNTGFGSGFGNQGTNPSPSPSPTSPSNTPNPNNPEQPLQAPPQ